jgi:Cu/Ag efflux protein CusF
MKKTTEKSNKGKEITISASELTRLGMGVMTRALNVVNTARKGKITIKLERE